MDGVRLAAHQITYDALQRWTKMSLLDGSYLAYSYNDRNELASVRHYWADASPVAGQQVEYGFDNIGNRTNRLSRGNASGANLRETTGMSPIYGTHQCSV